MTEKVSELYHGYSSCLFKADPSELEAKSCEIFHLTLKTTFACVDKSVLLAKFVDRVTTTTDPPKTTTVYKQTTTEVKSTKSENLNINPEYSTSYWNMHEIVDVEAEPLEPKPAFDKDKLPSIIQDGSAFAKVKF